MAADRTHRTWAEIDLDAIAHNLREIRRHTDRTAQIMAVVKADAYGHGAPQVAREALAHGASWLAVAMLEEAIELRRKDIKAPILILSDNEPECAETVVACDVRQAVSSYDMARRLSEAAGRLGKRARIHLKIDTGMGRIGFSPEQAPAEAERIARLDGIEIEGIFTHFAVADESSENADRYTERQYRTFCETCERIEQEHHIHIPLRHAANSAAILRFPHMHLDLVRAGIILYGLWPSGDLKACGADLRPAMTLKSAISHVKSVGPGSSLSYGRTYCTQEPAVIATIPAGYADGYFRVLGNRASVWHEKTGVRARVVGRVCMDQMLADVTQARQCGPVEPGDSVVLFGGNCDKMPSADEIAALAGTINYEVVCAVSRRVPRIFLKDGLVAETVNRLL